MAIFVSFLFLGADFGDVTLAANQILLQFLEITAYALDGFAFAAEALVGQAVGRGQRAAPAPQHRCCRPSGRWSERFCLSLAFALWGGAIVDLMAKAPEVQAEARNYLPYMVLVPVLGVAAGCWTGCSSAPRGPATCATWRCCPPPSSPSRW